MDIRHLKSGESEPTFQTDKGRVVLQGDTVKNDAGSHAVFAEQVSCASQMTPAQVMDALARLPGLAGEAAVAVPSCTSVKMEGASALLKLPNSECPDIWMRLPRHKWHTSWSNIEEPVVLLGLNLCGHPLAGLLWGGPFEKSSIGMKHFDLREPTSFLDHTWDALNETVNLTKVWLTTTETCSKRESLREQLKGYLTRRKSGANVISWSEDMEGHAKKCVERYCELANRNIQQLYEVATPCLDDHQFKEDELETVGDLSKVCSQIVLTYLYLARIGRPDILWSVKKLARAVTKWKKACNRRLAPLISYRARVITGNVVPWEILQSIADWDCSRFPILLGLEDSKSTTKGILCIFGSRTFVPIFLDVQETNFSFTVLLNLRLYLEMQVYAWTVSNQICRYQKPSRRHCNPGQFHS